MSEISQIGNGVIGELKIGKTTLYRTVTSHTSGVVGSASREINIKRDPTTRSDTITSDATSIISLRVNQRSSTTEIVSKAQRSGLTTSREAKASYTDDGGSYTYNNRTSLELIDYTVDWDNSQSVWYTPWVQQDRILGTEDTFVVRSQVVSDAKEPAAVIVIEYDSTGSGSPDATSEPISLGRYEQVHEVDTIPIDPSGRYRVKITEYSGYNSLYALNMGIIH